jgi:hypothetical protein
MNEDLYNPADYPQDEAADWELEQARRHSAFLDEHDLPGGPNEGWSRYAERTIAARLADERAEADRQAEKREALFLICLAVITVFWSAGITVAAVALLGDTA